MMWSAAPEVSGARENDDNRSVFDPTVNRSEGYTDPSDDQVEFYDMLQAKSLDTKLRATQAARNRVLGLKRELNAAKNMYQKRDNDDRVEQINKELATTQAVLKSVPQYRGAGDGDRFHKELNRWLATGAWKKQNAAMEQIRLHINGTYEKELGPLNKASASTGSGGGGSTPAARSAMEIYVISHSGDMEFYINGRKVTGNHQSFALHGAKTFRLRAVALGAKRKSARDFDAPANTTVEDQTDYRLHYKTRLGNFSGATDWWVRSEQYSWHPGKQLPRTADVSYGKSDKYPSLQNDEATFTFEAPFSYAASVSAKTEWKTRSTRPGGVRETNQIDNSTGKIQFTVGPAL